MIKLTIYICVFGVCIILGCANQSFPPGGPEDKTPPEVVNTVPSGNATNVSRTSNVEFEFSEKIQDNSIEGSIFISPNPGDELEIKVKSNVIQLKFADSLIADVTYSITMGTGIQDLRNNKLKESFTLGFSTGDVLDRKQISGRVFAEKPTEITVGAYFLSEEENIDPGKTKPIYITQCDAHGNFKLSNLAARKYRLFAIRDRNKNSLYNLGSEQVGITSSDVDLSTGKEYERNILFRMMTEDTSRVKILSVDQLDRRKLRLRFSQPVELSPDISNSIFLINSKGDTVQIISGFSNIDSKDIWSIDTTPRDSINHQLEIKNLNDEYKRSIQDTIKFDFKSIADPDTTKPILLSVFPIDSSYVNPYQNIAFTFSESMDTTRNDSLFIMPEDSTNSWTVNWNNPNRLELLPDTSWEGNKWMQLLVNYNQFSDKAGNQLKPDSIVYAWKIINPDTLSSISGTVIDQDTIAIGKYYLELDKVGAVIEKLSLQSENGNYLFNNILPGRYILSAFRDTDFNEIYSVGSTNPFMFSERFFVAPDTILVRARWPNEGNDYKLKQ